MDRRPVDNGDVIDPQGLQDYWDSFLRSMEADISLRIEDEGGLT